MNIPKCIPKSSMEQVSTLASLSRTSTKTNPCSRRTLITRRRIGTKNHHEKQRNTSFTSNNNSSRYYDFGQRTSHSQQQQQQKMKLDELIRIGAIGLTLMGTTWMVTFEDDDNDIVNSIKKNIHAFAEVLVVPASTTNHQSLLATSATTIHTHNNSNLKINSSSSSPPPSTSANNSIFLSKDALPSKEVDFIIIGCGNAGRIALQTLQQKCPQASILVIDPTSSYMMEQIIQKGQKSSMTNTNTNNNNTSTNAKISLSERLRFQTTSMKQSVVEYCIGSAIGYDHANQTVDIFSSKNQQQQQSQQQQQQKDQNQIQQNEKTSEQQSIKRIKYKHSLLIATGVRASPPPEALIDERATDRIVELRSTQLPSLIQHYYDNDSSINYHHLHHKMRHYPILSRPAVRQIALMASSQGSKVCILGSGIEAIELAAAVAKISVSSTSSSSNNNGNSKNSNSVSLIFGGAAPLSNILPRYLSSAVSKRLRSHGIDIQERSLVRYIGKSHKSQTGGIEVHMVKSFDSLDSNRCLADLLILAPSVSGQQGTAVIPTIKEGANAIPKLTFKPWSKLGAQKTLTSYSDDGRVVVNSELNAASNIYAAGSVAKYPNHFTGHATVAGEGVVDGALAGKIAAANMAKQYHNSMNFKEVTEDECEALVNNTFSLAEEEKLPILRTDKMSSSDDNTSALSSLGINALCVGQCDSENMSTHGFWWTNQFSRRMSRRSTNSESSRKERNGSPRAVFGSGIVFYLDRSASIRGIMVWGLPFTSAKGGDDANDLNKDLIERIEAIIRTNGRVIKTTHKKTIEDLNLDHSLLSQTHLMEESKYLASLAYSSSSSKKDPMKGLINTRPLHRYIPSKPINVTSMGVLKRNKAIGNGGVGDDIFERSIRETGADETMRHPSLVHFFSYDWSTSQPIQLGDESNEDELESSENMIVSRPPKEEALWLRRNEVMKTTSLSDKMAEMFEYNLRKGQFSDGNDAVKQAPTPEFVENARDEVNKWMGSANESQDNAE